MSEAIEEVVPAALAGERLDRVVAMVGDCSRGQAADLIANGGVTVNGATVTQRSHRLAEGARVLFAPPAQETAPVLADPSIEVPIVFEDEHLLVVNKPAGLVVHPGAGRPDSTLVNGLLAHDPEIREVGEMDRPGIVHRLDADTSGLLVVARTGATYSALVSLLADHDIDRQYRAVVHGLVVDDRGIVDAPIGRSSQRRTRMAVTASGRPARTHYEVLARRPEPPEATSLRCQLETGRTHQIRVHLDAIGHPVVGDPTYGSGRKIIDFPRVALHAERLAFVHPVTNEAVEFTVEPPADLAGLLSEVEVGLSSHDGAAPPG